MNRSVVACIALILSTLCVIFFWNVLQSAPHASAVNYIQSLGGTVERTPDGTVFVVINRTEREEFNWVMDALTASEKIAKLNIRDCFISEREINILANEQSLRQLHLAGCGIEPLALVAMQKLSQLKKLTIVDPSPDAGTMILLKNSLPMCEVTPAY